MPQSLSAVYIHLVFSTKDRRPFLQDKPLRERLHAQIGEISKRLGCPPILVGGVEDHVHLLARLGRTITQAEWVKEIKRVSSLWVKEQDAKLSHFEWQGGYAVFSLSKSIAGSRTVYCQSGGAPSADDVSGGGAGNAAETWGGMG